MKEQTINIEEQLEDLRKIYLDEIPDKLSEIEKHILHINEMPKDKEAIEQLIASLHKLRGSAGSYGFKEAGDKACELETELKCLLSGHLECDSMRIEQIKRCFEELKLSFSLVSSRQASVIVSLQAE